MMETVILEQPSARKRFLAKPCLEERERYLFHLMRRGYGPAYLRTVSFSLLRVIEFLRLTTLRMVEPEEIERAALAWAAYHGRDRRGKQVSGNTTVRFPRVAKNWLRFHGRLAGAPSPVHPYEKEITDFGEFLRRTNGATPGTIHGYSTRAKFFLSWLVAKGRALSNITLNDVDEFFDAKRAQGWSLSTIASHVQAMRAFFLHAEAQGWSPPGLARGIRKPALPKYDGVSRGPAWGDVRRLLRYASGEATTSSLRAHAMLLLCSIYALRSSEVSGLQLIDIDWREETFCVKRAKRGGYQRYPLQFEVGEAILRYLKVRPRCACRNVFVTFQQPYRPVSGVAVWAVVSHRFDALNIRSRGRGPHALRHACATHLLRKGIPLKDGTSGIEPGQIVAALPIHGAYAEFVCLPQRELVPVPSGLDAAEAVSLILNYITAYQMLHRSAEIRPGQRVLIHGAAGGVGSALLQLGSLAELEMYGTCSPRGASAVSDLGGIPIDYLHQDFVKEIHRLTGEGVDAVFDSIGGTHIWRSRQALRPGGWVVAFGLTSSLRGGRLASGRPGGRHRYRAILIPGLEYLR